MEINALSYMIIGCAIRVHRTVGPGLFENLYQACLQIELLKSGLRFDSQVLVPVRYGDVTFTKSLRVDLLVEDQIIVEVKSVANVVAIHRTQLLTYLKLTDKRLGLLINFNVTRLKDGITRIVNKLPE